MSPWKLLSCLLSYPDAELVEHLPELEEAAAGLSTVAPFLAWLGRVSLSQAQETYVRTFDLDPRASLHLTYHAYGDGQERGLELARLVRRYGEAGLELRDGELPDYLPAVLELAAVAPEAGTALLARFRPALERLRGVLEGEGSPYAPLAAAVLESVPQPSGRRQRSLA